LLPFERGCAFIPGRPNSHCICGDWPAQRRRHCIGHHACSGTAFGAPARNHEIGGIVHDGGDERRHRIRAVRNRKRAGMSEAGPEIIPDRGFLRPGVETQNLRAETARERDRLRIAARRPGATRSGVAADRQ
jgi:hypothetical protein